MSLGKSVGVSGSTFFIWELTEVGCWGRKVLKSETSGKEFYEQIRK